ncbi:hypothetical protein N431DRAFT_485765 [Stipitochalara longipes BDJ]|nr:hypothetical protein N431DRAFT_485765 [Stipitochalara longipes BDJ]
MRLTVILIAILALLVAPLTAEYRPSKVGIGMPKSPSTTKAWVLWPNFPDYASPSSTLNLHTRLGVPPLRMYPLPTTSPSKACTGPLRFNEIALSNLKLSMTATVEDEAAA